MAVVNSVFGFVDGMITVNKVAVVEATLFN